MGGAKGGVRALQAGEWGKSQRAWLLQTSDEEKPPSPHLSSLPTLTWAFSILPSSGIPSSLSDLSCSPFYPLLPILPPFLCSLQTPPNLQAPDYSQLSCTCESLQRHLQARVGTAEGLPHQEEEAGASPPPGEKKVPPLTYPV